MNLEQGLPQQRTSKYKAEFWLINWRHEKIPKTISIFSMNRIYFCIIFKDRNPLCCLKNGAFKIKTGRPGQKLDMPWKNCYVVKMILHIFPSILHWYILHTYLVTTIIFIFEATVCFKIQKSAIYGNRTLLLKGQN